jgi:hypothetical protein
MGSISLGYSGHFSSAPPTEFQQARTLMSTPFFSFGKEPIKPIYGIGRQKEDTFCSNHFGNPAILT